MSNKKRTLLTVVALALVCVMSIAGTLAYLKSYANPVTNTFVVGEIASLTLDESKAIPETVSNEPGEPEEPVNPGVSEGEDPVINEPGEGSETETPAEKPTGKYTLDESTRVTSNTYENLIPGTFLPKDPKVTVGATGMDTYLFIKATQLPTNIEWTEAGEWTQVPGTTDAWYQEVKASNTPQEFQVIANDQVKLKDTFTGTEKLEFEAYLIQKDGFETPAAAWTEAAKAKN